MRRESLGSLGVKKNSDFCILFRDRLCKLYLQMDLKIDLKSMILIFLCLHRSQRLPFQVLNTHLKTRHTENFKNRKWKWRLKSFNTIYELKWVYNNFAATQKTLMHCMQRLKQLLVQVNLILAPHTHSTCNWVKIR